MINVKIWSGHSPSRGGTKAEGMLSDVAAPDNEGIAGG